MAGVAICTTYCTQGTIDGKGYVSYVQDKKNGLIINQQQGVYHAILEYRPIELMILSELKKYTVTKNDYNKLYEKYKGAQYYNLKLGINSKNQQINIENYGVKSYKELDQKITDLSFTMEKDIYLIEGQDTLSPSIFHFERTYGLTPFKTFVLAFPDNGSIDKDKTVLIKSNFLNIKKLALTVKRQDINKIPKLTTY